MISVQGVSMRFGSKLLFEDVTTTFSPGRRYGLTGPHGAGKSTFLKILSGDIDPTRGSVSIDPGKRMAVLRGQGKPARTRYTTLETFGPREKPLAALIECRLETGRTHQIRVHLAGIGYPVIGDMLYGKDKDLGGLCLRSVGFQIQE